MITKKEISHETHEKAAPIASASATSKSDIIVRIQMTLWFKP